MEPGLSKKKVESGQELRKPKLKIGNDLTIALCGQSSDILLYRTQDLLAPQVRSQHHADTSPNFSGTNHSSSKSFRTSSANFLACSEERALASI